MDTSFQKTTASDEWGTPWEIVHALGEFDLDPCASNENHKAPEFYTKEDDGLAQIWRGRVWCNPPYSQPALYQFCERLSDHGNGILLIFARTGNRVWQETYNPQMTNGAKNHSRGNGKHKITNRCYGSFNEAEDTISEKKYPRSVLDFKRPHPPIHPTEKPVALLEYLIKTYTNEGETVLDNTMGSGSTGVACVNTGRNFIGIELNDEYFNIASERIKKAEEDNAGRLF